MTENLPILTPDVSRGAKTLARCHGKLAGRRRRLEGGNRPAGRRLVTAERLLLAGLCVVYLAAMAGQVLSIINASSSLQ